MGYDTLTRNETTTSSARDIERARNAFEAASHAYQNRVESGEFGDNFQAHLAVRYSLDELWNRWYALRYPDTARGN